MKINYYWGFVELESEDVRDQAWMESFIKINHKDMDFTIVDESKNTYGSKEVKLVNGGISGDIPEKLIFGNL